MGTDCDLTYSLTGGGNQNHTWKPHLLITPVHHTWLSHLVIISGYHTCSSHLVITARCHTYASHLVITVRWHTCTKHLSTAPAHHTCLSYLGIISVHHTWLLHLVITSYTSTPSYLFHMYLYYLPLDCHGSQVSRNSGPSLCKSSMWYPPVLPSYAWCPSKGSTLSPGPNTSLLLPPLLLICGLLSSCPLTLFPSNTLFSIPLGAFCPPQSLCP